MTYSNGHVLIATDETTGERFIVRAADPYRAACELAQAVGIELAARGWSTKGAKPRYNTSAQQNATSKY